MCTHAISFAWMTHLISEHFRVAVHEVSVTLRAYFILWIQAALELKKGLLVIYSHVYVVTKL